MVTFAESEKREEERVASAALRGVGLLSYGVTGAVDQESAVLQDDDAGDAREEKGTESAVPSIPDKTESRREDEADQDCDRLHMAILPADKLVFLQVRHIVVGLLRLQLEKQPSDVREEKAFRNTVRILVVIDMLMVTPVLARPHEDGILKRAGAEDEREQPDRPTRPKGFV